MKIMQATVKRILTAYGYTEQVRYIDRFYFFIVHNSAS